MSELVAAAFEYGIAFVVLAILIWYIHWSTKQHAKERAEWREESKLNTNRMFMLQEKSTSVVEQNTSAVEALRRLVESRG